MSPALTGAFIDITVVENLGETDEQEFLINQTTDDIELERDSEDAEWQEHNVEVMQRMELATSIDLTFMMILTDDRENLETAGVINSEGRVMRNVVHEAVRVHVFAGPFDDEPSTTYQAEDTQFKIEGFEFPIDDVATVEIIGWVNGDQFFQSGEAVEEEETTA